MFVPLLAVALAASPFSLAMPDLNAVSLAQGEGALYSQLLSQKLSTRGVKVITSRDFGAVMGLERQRALLNEASCNDSCVTELAAAMGVDALLVGDVGKPGTTYAVSFKVLSAKDGSALAIYSAQVPNADGMDAALDRAAWMLLKQLKTLRPELLPGTEPGLVISRGPRLAPLVPAGIGLLALTVGAVGLAVANGQLQALKVAETVPAAAQARDSGKALQAVGWAGIGVGLAALVVAAAVYYLDWAPTVSSAVWLDPNAVSIGVVGVFR